MKRLNKDKELISAYLDRELSSSEKQYIEERIKGSLELQKELDDIKKLKELTSSSYNKIPESPYFETRLYASLNSKNTNKLNIKRWIPVTTVALVTLTLMIVLKFNPELIDNIIEQQKSNLAGFYKEKLQPLLYAADLTNEDIFNFAVYKELPLDAANKQILRLDNDSAGTEFFEIKNTDGSSGSNNLKSFVTALDLNDSEKEMMDSIIGSYSDQLSALVLVDDKNAVAINPNIWNTRKVILADILAFAKRHAGQNYVKILPSEVAELDNNSIKKYVADAKTMKTNQYIFFTPDSIFEDNFVFDVNKFKVQMEDLKENFTAMNENKRELKEFKINLDSTYENHKKNIDKTKRYEIFIDKNQIKVNMPEIAVNIPKINLPDFDSIAAIIEEATRNMNVIVPPNVPVVVGKNNYNFNYKTDKPVLNKNTEVNLDSLMQQNNTGNELKNSKQNKLRQNKLKNNSDAKLNDSLLMHQNEDLKREMDNLKKELQKFRNEFSPQKQDEPGESKKSNQNLHNSDVKEI
ncbi:MAG: hypothetical protein RBT56_00035 [Ignavibacteriaceae bacterium]|jgi:hypothetical protein|nr:hypothetical protein [Ignavibacteriaceae bacterium]